MGGGDTSATADRLGRGRVCCLHITIRKRSPWRTDDLQGEWRSGWNSCLDNSEATLLSPLFQLPFRDSVAERSQAHRSYPLPFNSLFGILRDEEGPLS